MLLNNDDQIDYLCSLLYKLSKVKKNSFCSHLFHIQTEVTPSTKNLKNLKVPSDSRNTYHSIYVYKSSDLSDKLLKATLNYIEKYKLTDRPFDTYRIETIPMETRLVDINKDFNNLYTMGITYLNNPLFMQFSHCKDHTISISKLINSFPTAKHDTFELLNNWLFYLYQLVGLNKIAVQQTKEFYTQLNQRNKSVKKLVNSISSNLVLKNFCQIDIFWNAPPTNSEDFFKNHHIVNNLRIQILSTLRNEFSKQKYLLPVKYLWLLTSNQPCKVSIELHVITQKHEEEGLKVFKSHIEKLLAKFHRIAQDHEFNVSVQNHQNPIITTIDKTQLSKELSFKQQGFFIDFPKLPKSSFGCGGIGGRTYK